MADGGPFDPNMWYRLTSASLDVGGALASNDNEFDDSGGPSAYVDLAMVVVADEMPQLWQISLNPNGYYNLCNYLLGPSYRLGSWKENNTTYVPALYIDPSEDVPDQQWNMTSNSDGAVSLTNSLIEPASGLTLYLDFTGEVPEFKIDSVGNALAWSVSEVLPIDNDTYSSIPPGSSSTIIASAVASEAIVSTFFISIETLTQSAKPTASSASAGSLTHPATHSTTVAPTTSTTPIPRKGETSVVMAAGIGIGAAAGLLLFCAFAGYFILRRHRRRRSSSSSGRSENPENHVDRSPEHDEERKAAAAASSIEEKQYAGPQAVSCEDQGLEGQDVSELGTSHMVGRTDGPNDVPELQ